MLETIPDSLGPCFDMGRQFVVVMSPTLHFFSGVFFFIALGQLRSHRGKFEHIWPMSVLAAEKSTVTKKI